MTRCPALRLLPDISRKSPDFLPHLDQSRAGRKNPGCKSPRVHFNETNAETLHETSGHEMCSLTGQFTLCSLQCIGQTALSACLLEELLGKTFRSKHAGNVGDLFQPRGDWKKKQLPIPLIPWQPPARQLASATKLARPSSLRPASLLV